MNDKNHEQVEPIVFFEPQEFIPVDEWNPEPEDEVFKTVKDAIILDVSSCYGMEPHM